MTHLIKNGESGFPPLLMEIPLAPKAIYIRGTITNDRPHIAIVGTRKASRVGRDTARIFARELSQRGVIVVSGLALGVDTAAHDGVVEVGGQTIAVLANGLDSIYPRQNHNLAEKIIKHGGALISEYPEGTPSYPNQFLERNRIVSGLSLGVIVIEAPARSGSLATARFALEQNRDVFVVPGPINHPNYEGSHKLIKDGAALVTSINDVLEALNITVPEIENLKLSAALSDEENKILENIKKSGRPVGADQIAEQSRLPLVFVNRGLTMLLVKGIISESGGKYFLR